MNKKELVGTIITFCLALFVGFVVIAAMSNMGRMPIHPDGYLWVYYEGDRTEVTRMTHENIQGFCEFVKNQGFNCGLEWPGCGAHNCECYFDDNTNITRLRQAVTYWSLNHNCQWIQGEGVVCE